MPVWIKFKLIERPYYDPRDGKILNLIKDRENRPKIDPFIGGGKVYPKFNKINILEQYEKDGILLLRIDDTVDVSNIKTKTEILSYFASPKVEIEYDYKDFEAIICTDEEVEILKIDVFSLNQDN